MARRSARDPAGGSGSRVVTAPDNIPRSRPGDEERACGPCGPKSPAPWAGATIGPGMPESEPIGDAAGAAALRAAPGAPALVGGSTAGRRGCVGWTTAQSPSPSSSPRIRPGVSPISLVFPRAPRYSKGRAAICGGTLPQPARGPPTFLATRQGTQAMRTEFPGGNMGQLAQLTRETTSQCGVPPVAGRAHTPVLKPSAP